MRFFTPLAASSSENLYTNLQVRTAVIWLTAACAAATAEHLAENIGKIEALRATESALAPKPPKPPNPPAPAPCSNAAWPYWFVHGTFFLVGQGVVSFLDFFKFFLPLLYCQDCGRDGISLPACGRLFDFIVASAAGNTKGFVKIFIAHNFDSVKNEFKLGGICGRVSKTQVSISRPSETKFQMALIST